MGRRLVGLWNAGSPVWNKGAAMKVPFQTVCAECSVDFLITYGNKSNRGRIYRIKRKGDPAYCTSICRERSKRRKISKTLMGHPVVLPSPEVIARRAFNRRGKLVGPLNPNWQGGLTSANRLLRSSPDHTAWRRAIKKRDNYTCVLCGRSDGPIHADHIKPFSRYPELRLEMSNGRTLCEPCHRATPTWGGKAKLGWRKVA
jgi:hypothetical protein